MEPETILIVNAIKKALQLTGKDKIKLSKTSTGKYSWEISLAIIDGEMFSEWSDRVKDANKCMLDSFNDLNKSQEVNKNG